MTNRSGSIVEGLPGFLKERVDFFDPSSGNAPSSATAAAPSRSNSESEDAPVDVMATLAQLNLDGSPAYAPSTPNPLAPPQSTWNSAPPVSQSTAAPKGAAPPFDLPPSGTTPPPPASGPQFGGSLPFDDKKQPAPAPGSGTSAAPAPGTVAGGQQSPLPERFPLHPQGFPPPPLFGNFSVPPMPMHPQSHQPQGGLWNQVPAGHAGPHPLVPQMMRHPPFLQSNNMFQSNNLNLGFNSFGAPVAEGASGEVATGPNAHEFHPGYQMPSGPPLQGPHPGPPHHGQHRRMANVHRKSGHRRKGDDASKYAHAKLEDFSGDIYALCKDQHGCRFLQRQLDADNATVAATMIFNEIYLKIVELMTDPFGNYLIQKLFERVSHDQRVILVKNAAPDFVRVALDPHGTRALQKLVECIDNSPGSEEVSLVVAALSPHVVELSRDLNGNHVVQKCLQRLAPDQDQFVFDAAAASCVNIATHRHGCCVLQRCLDHGSSSQRAQLSAQVAANATALSLDPFGNYVVQYVLARGDEASISTILTHIRSNIVTLSLHKFGSNVIEKSLRIPKLSPALVDELLKHTSRFGELLNDAFGNYVLQTALDVAPPADVQRLSAALQPLLPQIKNTPHGRRIMTKIQAIM
ncbi:hypothetical protein DICA3_B05644 [Diutina catenulata]